MIYMKIVKDYPQFVRRELCTGCGACQQICPKNAIIMKKDSKGFVYPYLVYDQCIKCMTCLKVCAIRKQTRKERQ